MHMVTLVHKSGGKKLDKNRKNKHVLHAKK